MKMRREYFEILSARINYTMSEAYPSLADCYRRRDVPRADKVVDIDKRFRWDMLSFVMREDSAVFPFPGSNAIEWSNLYAYLNDDTIDTALRRIVPKL